MPAGVSRGVQWVSPALVAQVSFSTWTADRLVRQASFKGLREDKAAKSVRREEPEEQARGEAAKGETTSSHRDPAVEKNKTVKSAESRGEPAKSAKTSKAATKSGSNLTIRLTHPDKVLDESTGVTKAALARYYDEIAEFMLPYIADRPLTLVRCVDGSGKPCFYQKHKNQMLSDSFDSIDVVDKKSGKPEPYITLSTKQPVVELAQIAVLEVHPWGSRNESLETPDRIIFDLDPDAAIKWETLTASAMEIRKRLKALGLKSFVKSTGGKGLHVVTPIRPEHPWPVVKQFAHEFVLGLEKEAPQLFLTKMTKAARVGKIYLDYLRNERGATAVAAFSPRARAGLPVAIPLDWNELSAAAPPRLLVADFAEWKMRLKRDPWKEMRTLDQQLRIPE
jgi:bifunctional non-homologous end joining protein LigD